MYVTPLCKISPEFTRACPVSVAGSYRGPAQGNFHRQLKLVLSSISIITLHSYLLQSGVPKALSKTPNSTRWYAPPSPFENSLPDIPRLTKRIIPPTAPNPRRLVQSSLLSRPPHSRRRPNGLHTHRLRAFGRGGPDRRRPCTICFPLTTLHPVPFLSPGPH